MATKCASAYIQMRAARYNTLTSSREKDSVLVQLISKKNLRSLEQSEHLYSFYMVYISLPSGCFCIIADRQRINRTKRLRRSKSKAEDLSPQLFLRKAGKPNTAVAVAPAHAQPISGGSSTNTLTHHVLHAVAFHGRCGERLKVHYPLLLVPYVTAVV